MSRKHLSKLLFVTVVVTMMFASIMGFPTTPAVQAAEPFTIGLSMHFMRDDYAVCVVSAAEAVAKKYGGTIVATDANADPQKQLADVENLVAQNVDALIVVPFDEKAILPGLEKANEKGIPIIAITTIPDADYIVSTVGGDGDYQNGLATGQFLVDKLGGTGKVAVIELNFSLWRIDERVRGFEDAIKDTAIEIVARQSGVAQDEVQNVVQNILVANPDLDGIWCTFSNQIVGASDALQAADKSDVVLTGIDADKAIMARINEGWVTGTAAQFPEVHGTLATEAAFQYLMGKEVEKEQAVPVMMVSQDNLVEAYSLLWAKCAPGEVPGLDMTQKKEYTIGLSMHFMRDDYAVCVVSAAEAVAKEYGGKVVATDANADPQKQLADVENLVAQNVDALIVVPFDEKAILPGLEKANEKGIPIIAITTIPDADYIVSTVGGDGDYQNGLATGQFLVDKLGGTGKVAVIELNFSLWRIDERVRGFEDAIKDTAIEIVARQSGVAQDEVQNVVQNILVANPDLDGIWCTFSNQIVGASDALQAADKSDVVLTGIDADKAIMARINEGWVTGSAAQFPEVHGTLATQAAFQYLMGVKVAKELPVPVMMVSKDNLVQAYYELWAQCAPGEIPGLDLTAQ